MLLMKEVVMFLLLDKMGSWGIRTQQMEKYLGQQAHRGFSRLTAWRTNNGYYMLSTGLISALVYFPPVH